MRTRNRAPHCAALAAALVVAAGCKLGDEPASPDAGTTEQEIGINGPGGWLHGTVIAAGFTGIDIPLPGAAMHAHNIMTLVNTPSVSSDFYGGFRIPVANGSYRICWSKSGYTSGCTTTIHSVNDKSRSAGRVPIAIASARKLRGTALLADKTTCLTQDRFMSTEIIGRADLVTAANVVIATTPLNFRGEWVLPDPGTSLPSHKVRATCAGITAEAPTISMNPSTPFPLTFANFRPVVRPVQATAGGADATRGVSPGTVISLSTSAIDPNGHPMTFRWRATAGTLVNTGTTNATWTAPATPGTHHAYFAANDGRGGYTTRGFTVRVRTVPQVVFTGNVRDDLGAIIPGATVSVAGATTTTDAAGHFQLTAAEADNYLLNISKMGHAELSQNMRRPSRGQRYTLIKAFAVPIVNPGAVNIITDGRERWLGDCSQPTPGGPPCRRVPGRVTIPANALLLEPPPVGGLTAYIATYDATREALPGDQSAINAANQPTALISYGALFIEVRDAAGTTYNIAPGMTARVEIPFQAAIAAEGPPPAMDMWKYHPSTGLWSERSTAGARIGNYYVVDVPSFSTQNADIEKANPACLYIDVDNDVFNAFQMNMRLQVPVSLGGAVRVYEKPLDELRNTVYNLPTNVPYTLEIFEAINGTNVLRQNLTGGLGNAWGGVGNPGLNEPDCAIATVTMADIVGSSGTFNRFLERKGIGDLVRAQAYYAAIDPGDARATLGGFWSTNGFDGNGNAVDQAEAEFINFNDLGFGRDMHCRRGPDPGDVACYVTNYGVGDQAPGNFDLAQLGDQSLAGATVAMEYSDGPGGPPKIVKFYAYAGGLADSERVASADLDGAGQKFLPNLCLNCHGGTYQPANPNNPTVPELDMGSSFREFDIYSYRDGTLGDKPNTLASGLTAILAQEADFLELNEHVVDSAPEPAISALVGQFYNGNGTLPFDQDAVPPAWNLDASTADLYRKVVAKACRTCHLAQPNVDQNSMAWATYEQFRNYRTTIGFAVCFGDPVSPTFEEDKRFRYMPHANVTFKNFWLDADAHTTLGNFTRGDWPASINSAGGTECVP